MGNRVLGYFRSPVFSRSRGPTACRAINYYDLGLPGPARQYAPESRAVLHLRSRSMFVLYPEHIEHRSALRWDHHRGLCFHSGHAHSYDCPHHVGTKSRKILAGGLFITVIAVAMLSNWVPARYVLVLPNPRALIPGVWIFVGLVLFLIIMYFIRQRD